MHAECILIGKPSVEVQSATEGVDFRIRAHGGIAAIEGTVYRWLLFSVSPYRGADAIHIAF